MVISAYEDLSFVADLMRNGVGRKAYLLKHSISDIAGLVRVVEAVYGGHTVLDSGIIQRMARLFCKYSGALGTELSGTEQDVLVLVADGYDDDLICETLRLGQTQIEGHAASTYAKFGISGGSPIGTKHRSGPSVRGTDTQNPIIQSLRCRGLETM